jgi:hypothetical protein
MNKEDEEHNIYRGEERAHNTYWCGEKFQPLVNCFIVFSATHSWPSNS